MVQTMLKNPGWDVGGPFSTKSPLICKEDDENDNDTSVAKRFGRSKYILRSPKYFTFQSDYRLDFFLLFSQFNSLAACANSQLVCLLYGGIPESYGDNDDNDNEDNDSDDNDNDDKNNDDNDNDDNDSDDKDNDDNDSDDKDNDDNDSDDKDNDDNDDNDDFDDPNNDYDDDYAKDDDDEGNDDDDDDND